MELQNLYPGSWGANCYLLTVGTHAAVVDPSANADSILAVLEERGATLEMILLTHGHFDHILSLDLLREKTGAKAYIGKEDFDAPSDAERNAFSFFARRERTWNPPDVALSDGDTLFLGGEPICVIHTPGHTPGGILLLCDNRFLLTGDTLFADTYGRYDLPGGDGRVLMETLKSLRRLPQHLPIYPGHGNSATLGSALDRIGIPSV